MKIKFVIIFVSLCCLIVNGQTMNNGIIPQKTMLYLNNDCLNAIMKLNNYSLYATLGIKDTSVTLLTPLEMADYFNKYVDKLSVNANFYKDYSLRKKMINAMYNNCTSDIMFMCEKGGFPLKFLNYINGGKCVLFLNGTSSNVYNTLKSTERQRAAKELSSYAIPWIKQAKVYFNDIQYIGIFICYYSKNFAEESYNDVECALIISPVSIINKYEQSQITEDDVINKSDLYMISKTSTDLKKVKLTLE